MRSGEQYPRLCCSNAGMERTGLTQTAESLARQHSLGNDNLLRTSAGRRRMPAYQRVMLVVVVVVLTLVPALISASGTRSSVRIGLASAPGDSPAPGTLASYVRGIVEQDLQAHKVVLVKQLSNDVDSSFYRTLRVEAAVVSGRSGVTISGTSTSFGWALKVLRYEAAKVATASRQGQAFWRRVHYVLLPAYERKLARPGLSPADRRYLLGRETFLRIAAGPEPPARPLQVGNAVVTLHGLRDRIIAAMPGSARPVNPVWAATAGLALAMALCFAWVSQFRSRETRRAAVRSGVVVSPEHGGDREEQDLEVQ
jgi:hypothetical protein